MIPAWTDAHLNQMREVMDPFADEAAAGLIAVKDLRQAMQLLHFLARNDAAVDMSVNGFSLPPVLQNYFNDTSHFNFTTEQQGILDRASDIFAQYAPVVTGVLGVRSLLKQYAHTKATNVLRMTTLLTGHVDRRITETFQFVMDVMQKGWYKPNQRGIRAIQKLRLIHALIRYRILHGMTPQSEGSWDPTWGQPINQEDMIFANQTFSVEVVNGMAQGGFHLSDEDREIYVQAWVLIGKALGVDSSLEPASYAQAAALQQRIYKRQFTMPNPNGPPLAKALIRFLRNIMPFEAGEKSILTIVKYFDGEENYRILEQNLKLPLNESHPDLISHLHQKKGILDPNDQVEGLDKMTEEELQHGTYPQSVRARIMEIFMTKLMRSLFHHKRGSKSTSFQIDDALANRWGLPGNEGIPAPSEPPLDGPKKRHPILKFLFQVGTWIMELVVKIRELFAGKRQP